MTRTRRPYLLATLALALLVVAPAAIEAQVCRTGKPCGNTCIARNRTCRVGQGTARAAPGSAPAAAPNPAPAPVAAAIPEGAAFVASSRGRVYYWVGCSGWKGLSAANLRWFRTRAEVEAAGYTPSLASGCAGPPDTPLATAPVVVAPALATRPAAVLGRLADPCTVASVTDGDTLECTDGRRIRLLLVDTPEMNQAPYGEVAKRALEAMATPGLTLAVETDVELQDRYGRALAHLYGPDGTSLNEALLRLGVAVVSVYPPNVNHVEAYRAAAEEAQAARRGLWALDAFRCLPADFRAGRCW